MDTYYYLTVYPMEAMIASQLNPEEFGSYMAVGDRKGSAESLMFFEVSETGLDAAFDLDYSREKCVPHADGRLKNSVYLSVYRALESVPVGSLGGLWLVTRDGRGLRLEQSPYRNPETWPGTALYQELCPSRPLVATIQKPGEFCEYIVGGSSKVTMPAFVFADLTMPDLSNPNETGNTGGYYVNKYDHLKSCMDVLRSDRGKLTKVVNRSASASFGYQVIGRGGLPWKLRS